MNVLNKRTDTIPEAAVYVGRPSMWGNPFHVTLKCSREQAVSKYKTWFLERIAHDPDFRAATLVLAGKDLVCWCAPELCHAEVIREWVCKQRKGGGG